MSINFRGNIDKAAPSFFLHAWECSLSEKEGAHDEEIKHRAVEFFIVVLDRFLRLVRRGVGNDNIDSAQFVTRLFDEAFDFGFL